MDDVLAQIRDEMKRTAYERGYVQAVQDLLRSGDIGGTPDVVRHMAGKAREQAESAYPLNTVSAPRPQAAAAR